MSPREKDFDSPPTCIPRLLVSVRDATEAAAALAGGADIIDVKEPHNGPLGMANVSQIEDVLHTVRKQTATTSVSVALGDAGDWTTERSFGRLPKGLNYVKLGTANLAHSDDWQTIWRSACGLAVDPAAHAVAIHDSRFTLLRPPSTIHRPPFTIPVAYADWRLAASPAPYEVIQLAITAGCAGVLIDTFAKNGLRLLDWLEPRELAWLANLCRRRGLWLALAGGLNADDIPQLDDVAFDIVGIRSAACQAGQRLNTIDARAVAEFKQALRQRWNATRRSAAPVRAGCTN